MLCAPLDSGPMLQPHSRFQMAGLVPVVGVGVSVSSCSIIVEAELDGGSSIASPQSDQESLGGQGARESSEFCTSDAEQGRSRRGGHRETSAGSGAAAKRCDKRSLAHNLVRTEVGTKGEPGVY